MRKGVFILAGVLTILTLVSCELMYPPGLYDSLSNAGNSNTSSPRSPGNPSTNSVDNSPPTYTISYNANGGTGSLPSAPTGYTNGQLVTVPGNTGGLSYSGYTFEGWTTSITGNGESFDSSGTVTFSMPSSNMTLYAVWVPDSLGASIVSSGNSITITGPANYSGDLVIPFGVTAIASHAFDSDAGLKSVTIPPSVTSIGQDAFEFSAITNVIIPSSITSIPTYAFYYCASLSGPVVIPASVTNLGQWAFGYTEGNLHSLTFEGTNCTFGGNNFDQNPGETVYAPAGGTIEAYMIGITNSMSYISFVAQ